MDIVLAVEFPLWEWPHRAAIQIHTHKKNCKYISMYRPQGAKTETIPIFPEQV